jgi:site-specific DNA-methyltransferase (adenine-specific)
MDKSGQPLDIKSPKIVKLPKFYEPAAFLNRIICGDAAKILKKFPDDCCDMILTSPPYDSARSSKDYKESFDFKTIANELTRILKPGGTIVWNVNDMINKGGGKTGTTFRQALYFMDECGLLLQDIIIVNKNSFAFPSKTRYHQNMEIVLILSKGPQSTFNGIKDRKNKYLGKRGASGRNKDGTRNKGKIEIRNEWGMRMQVWDITIGGGHSSSDKKYGYLHPAIMPEKLARDLIISYSKIGDLVVDPFNGGGTSILEAKKLSRNYCGIEISPEYVKLAKKRLKGI